MESFAREERLEFLGGETVLSGALTPCRDEVVGRGVVLGWPGAQHDVFDLFGVGASADLGFEFP